MCLSPTNTKQKRPHPPELKRTKSQGTRKMHKAQSSASMEDTNGGGASDLFFLLSFFFITEFIHTNMHNNHEFNPQSQKDLFSSICFRNTALFFCPFSFLFQLIILKKTKQTQNSSLLCSQHNHSYGQLLCFLKVLFCFTLQIWISWMCYSALHFCFKMFCWVFMLLLFYDKSFCVCIFALNIK